MLSGGSRSARALRKLVPFRFRNKVESMLLFLIILGMLFVVLSMVFVINPPEAWIKRVFHQNGKDQK